MGKKAGEKEVVGPAVESGRAVELLRRQLEQFERVNGLRADDPEVRKWMSTTEGILEAAFGQGCEPIREFRNRYGGSMLYDGTCEREHHERMLRRKAVVESCIERLEMLNVGAGERSDGLAAVLRVCEKFHAVSMQLLQRRRGRETVRVEDEYDVQDLMHALLRMFFDDVRTEEWTPSHAGGAARMDFLLKAERIVVEVKMARKGLGAKEVAEELILDAARYRAHPDCGRLVCFVYDPWGAVRNPEGVERDLAELSGPGMEVRCLVRP